jgi:hypothetical protein
MSIRSRTFQVTSNTPVMVETEDGNAMSFPAGKCFVANPLSPHIVRLLRINAIREVTSREIPNTGVSR